MNDSEPKARRPKEEMTATVTITEPAQAHLLLHPGKQELLAPFMNRENTISRAAGEAGASVTQMYRFVQEALNAQLLMEVKRTPNCSGGRDVRTYRSTAEQYFVPLKLDPVVPAVRERVTATAQGLLEDYLRSMQEYAEPRAVGYYIRSGQVAGTRTRLHAVLGLDDGKLVSLETPGSPPALLRLGELRLTYEEALDLQRELRAVIAKYQYRSYERDGCPFSFMLAFAPQSA